MYTVSFLLPWISTLQIGSAKDFQSRVGSCAAHQDHCGAARLERLDLKSYKSDCAPHTKITAAQRAWSAWISKATSRIMRRTPRSLRRSALGAAGRGFPKLPVGLCAAHQNHCGAARQCSSSPRLDFQRLCATRTQITAMSALAGRSRRAAAARQSGTASAARAGRLRAARAQSCQRRA